MRVHLRQKFSSEVSSDKGSIRLPPQGESSASIAEKMLGIFELMSRLLTEFVDQLRAGFGRKLKLSGGRRFSDIFASSVRCGVVAVHFGI